MAAPLLSHRRAHSLAGALLLVGLALLSFLGSCWPALLLVLGIPLALHQWLLGRRYDSWISLLIFGGGFVLSCLSTPRQILLPILFLTSAFYLLLREWVEESPLSEEEMDEDLNHQIEEQEDK